MVARLRYHRMINLLPKGNFSDANRKLKGKTETSHKIPVTVLMPANNHLDDNAIASILTYVRRRFGGIENNPIKAKNVKKVRDLSTAKK